MKEGSWASWATWADYLRLGVTAAAVALLCAGGQPLRPVLQALTPLLWGGGLACVVDIPMAALERRFFPRGGRLARALCLALALLLVLAGIAWLAGVILPEAVQCLLLLASRLPGLLETLLNHLQGAEIPLVQSLGLPQWQTLARQGMQLALEEAGPTLCH